ncbi:hypothetical protein [Sphingomonas sp.]
MSLTLRSLASDGSAGTDADRTSKAALDIWLVVRAAVVIGFSLDAAA